MPQRRFSLFDLFLFVAFCSLLLAFLVPVFRRGAGRGKRVQGLAFSADGSTVAALFGDGKVRVWRASDQTLLAAFDSGAMLFQSRIAISSDGSLAAIFTGHHPRRKGACEIEIWDIGNSLKTSTVSCLWDASLVFSPTDALLAVGHQDSSIDLYRCVEDGPPRLLRKLNADDEAISQAGQCPPLAFSGDGSMLAAQSSEAIWFWNVETGEQGKPLAIGHELSAGRMDLSRDGKYLASSGYDTQAAKLKFELDIWDVAASKKIPALPRGQEPDDALDGFHSLAFMPDGRTLLVADESFRVWDLKTRKVHVLPVLTDASPPMLASPRRGNRFAVAEFQKITLWDAAALKPREVLWMPPARSQPIPVLLGTAALLFIWMFRSARKLKRRCATCGQSFYLANRKDLQTECPVCRLRAMPAEERKQEQSKESRQQRKIWWTCGVGIFAGIIIAVFKDRAPFLVAGAAVLAIPAGIFVVLGVAIGFVVLKHRWRRRGLLREENFVKLAEQSAGSPGETMRFGPVLVWSEPGATAGCEIEPQLAAVSARVHMLTGQSPSLDPWFRCFVFSNRMHFAKCLEGSDTTPINLSELSSLYLPNPWRTALVDESQLRERTERPLEVVRGLIASRFVDALGVSQRRPWLSIGLGEVISDEPNANESARLNRRMLAALAAKCTLDAQKFFAKAPLIKFFNALHVNELSFFAKTAAEADQYWSFMEFLCGAGATPERRLAFQRFLADPRRQKRQDEALVVHFGCSPEQLLDDWRGWVEQVGVGEHAPPPAEYAELLASGPAATIADEQAPLVERSRAIRRLGREGFAVGVDALFDILRRGPEELAAEAVWALEAISGRPLGADVAAWEAWRAGLPAESRQTAAKG